MVKIFASIIEDEAKEQINDTVDIVKEIKPIYNFKAKN
jgi:hypothetical protein